MIDGLVGQCGEHLSNLWKRDEGGTGQYPPPTLHVSFSLIYLLVSLILNIPVYVNMGMEELIFTFLQALLDIYLLDNIDEAAKHAVVSFE